MVNPAAIPSISVIIATYNWSSALRYSIASVLAQTFEDFECLVVGDHCTDDSAEVVASFGDPRLIWVNLDARHGSQWGPNNHGLSLARGASIAYLGHDDLWWSTHLEAASRTMVDADADAVASVCCLYGPTGSGIRAVTGLFPGGEFIPSRFFPPSSLVHRKSLIDAVGGWRRPPAAAVAVDYDLLKRFHEHGARFASTHELTVFKFNAAWRRNAYLDRRTHEQADLWRRMQAEPLTFRETELTAVLQAEVEDRLMRIAPVWVEGTNSAGAHAATGRFKGSTAPATRTFATLPSGGIRYVPDEAYAGFEWYVLEQQGARPARWSGPSRISSIMLPVGIVAPCRVTLHVVRMIAPSVLETAVLQANGRPLDTEILQHPEEGHLWTALIRPDGEAVDMLTIVLERVFRPSDLYGGEDRRWLGLAVSAVDLVPAADLDR